MPRCNARFRDGSAFRDSGRWSDTFSGADGTSLPSHAPDVNVPGQPWTVSGPMAVLHGQQVMPWSYDPSSFLSTAMIDTGTADGTVAVDWTPTPASATTVGFPLGALVVRGVDPYNYLGIGYGIWGGNGLVIARFVGGVWTLVAIADPGPLAGRTHHLEVKLAGSRIFSHLPGQPSGPQATCHSTTAADGQCDPSVSLGSPGTYTYVLELRTVWTDSQSLFAPPVTIQVRKEP